MKKSILIIWITLITITTSSFAQNDSIVQDSLFSLAKKNVLKWNLTPMIWSVSNINLSYERVTSPNGSFSINAGYFVLPSFGLYDSINITRANKKWGFSVSGDKRFYFKKRNKNFAPDGLYWGIFGSIHYYDFENNFEIANSDIAKGNLKLNGNFGMISAGVELGYQFVFKNNLTVDLIFIGPSLSSYTAKLEIDGDLKVDEDSEYIKAIYDVIIGRFPGADKLIDEKQIKDNGTLFSVGPGLRYMIQIGYRF